VDLLVEFGAFSCRWAIASIVLLVEITGKEVFCMKKIEISAPKINKLLVIVTRILMVLAFFVLFQELGMSNLLAVGTAGVLTIIIHYICNKCLKIK
jgi:hypothetical protein